MVTLSLQPVQEHQAAPEFMLELLQTFKATLLESGMASMDEYGDMLNWALPRRDGMSRSLHVFHPGFCSFSDAWRGTIHYHGGTIRGTILAGSVEHYTYDPEASPSGDRFLGETGYTLTRHTHPHGAGTTYELPAFVPHWLKPLELTLTYFEEEDNGEMGDLLNPQSEATDDHVWEQENADALLPEVLELLDKKINALLLNAS